MQFCCINKIIVWKSEDVKTGWSDWVGKSGRFRIRGLISVVMKSTVFWDMTPCSSLEVNRRFGGTSPPSSRSDKRSNIPAWKQVASVIPKIFPGQGSIIPISGSNGPRILRELHKLHEWFAINQLTDFAQYQNVWTERVGIVSGCRLDDREIGVLVPVGSRIFTSPCHPDRLWGSPNLLYDGYRG
jgi:hypothetical protein